MNTCIYDTVRYLYQARYGGCTELLPTWQLHATLPDFSLIVSLLREPNSNNTYWLSLLAFTTVSTI